MKPWIIFQAALYFLATTDVQAARDAEAEKTSEYWTDVAQTELEGALEQQKLNTNVAKNVIIFLGDGMGVSTITAGRILKGQLNGESGEETKLAMEKFPHTALSKTYSVDKQVADSASTATAYLCGIKSNYFTIGVNAATERNNCQSSKGNEVKSVLMDSYDAGKATGVVSTTRLNHATPGATYAHTAHRKWYSDADLTNEAKQNGCKDIAMQFYDASDKITVTLAGGRAFMRPENTTDYEYPSKYNVRKDGNDLIEMWEKKMESKGLEPEFVWNKDQFDAVNVAATDRLLGLFEPKDMQYEANRAEDGGGEPSIAEMTSKAIKLLQKNENGFFLLVEGGRIDHGHHAGNAHLALHDVVAFDDAIQRATEMTSEEDTLIIVTADHSHVFTMGGYSDRGNDIFGLAPSNGDPEKVLDRKPYTTLLYANGPGYQGYHVINDEGYKVPDVSNMSRGREDLSDVDTGDSSYKQQTAVPIDSETHGGEDVAIFARGPMAHLFHGVHEQNYIAHVMRYASCVGGNKSHCDGNSDVKEIEYFGNQLSASSAQTALRVQAIIMVLMGLILLILLVYICKSWKTFHSKKKEASRETSMPLTRDV